MNTWRYAAAERARPPDVIEKKVDVCRSAKVKSTNSSSISVRHSRSNSKRPIVPNERVVMGAEEDDKQSYINAVGSECRCKRECHQLDSLRISSYDASFFVFRSLSSASSFFL